MAVLLRPGKTPSGAEVRILLKHLVRRIRRHWPRTRLTFRGDRIGAERFAAAGVAWSERNQSCTSWRVIAPMKRSSKKGRICLRR